MPARQAVPCGKPQKRKPGIVLVSACLVGLLTRYDGQGKKSAACLAALRNRLWVPVCPEQLGGLPTPRSPADLVGGDGEAVLDGAARVLNSEGNDVTEHFVRGAQQVLKIAVDLQAETVFLKANSPSCGNGERKGVCAALLIRHGYKVFQF